MTGRKITIGNAVIYMRKLKGTAHMRIRIKEQDYLLKRPLGKPPLFQEAPDLPAETLERIIWAASHYFPLKQDYR